MRSYPELINRMVVLHKETEKKQLCVLRDHSLTQLTGSHEIPDYFLRDVGIESDLREVVDKRRSVAGIAAFAGQLPVFFENVSTIVSLDNFYTRLLNFGREDFEKKSPFREHANDAFYLSQISTPDLHMYINKLIHSRKVIEAVLSRIAQNSIGVNTDDALNYESICPQVPAEFTRLYQNHDAYNALVYVVLTDLK